MLFIGTPAVGIESACATAALQGTLRRVDISLSTVRVFVHVLAAVVWVGGQLTLAGLVPTLRTIGTDAPKKVARRFNLFAWPAFAILTFTGIWNAFEVHFADQTSAYRAKFGLKMTCYLITGVGAALHSFVPKRWALALGGAMAGLGAVGALFFAVSLRY